MTNDIWRIGISSLTDSEQVDFQTVAAQKLLNMSEAEFLPMINRERVKLEMKEI